MKIINLFTSFAALLMCASFFLLSSCGDDEKPKNQFKVNGKSYALANGYTDALLDISDNGSAHYVVLVGKDLEVDEDGFMSGEDHFFVLQIGSTDADVLASDTYEIDIDVYEFGRVPEIFAAVNYHFVSDGDGGFDPAFDQGFYPYEGTVKVSKSGSKFTFNIKVSEFDHVDENGDEQEGEGSLRGYFSGELTNVEIFNEVEELRVPAKVRQIFEDLHKKENGFAKGN